MKAAYGGRVCNRVTSTNESPLTAEEIRTRLSMCVQPVTSTTRSLLEALKGMLLLTIRALATLLIMVLASRTVAQQDPDGFERLLLPIVSEPLPGANGSVWETEVWMMRHDPGVFVGPIVNRACLPPCGPPPAPIPAGDAVRPSLYRTRAGEPQGILLFVTRGKADTISLSVRVADATRRSASAGVSIPVVAERDLRAVVHLLDIHPRGQARVRVRIYDPFAEQPVSVRIRVFRTDAEDSVVYEADTVLLVPESEPLPGWHLPVRPASAELPLPDDVVSLDAPLRVEITPLAEGARLWAFATITNNKTNEVTVVVP